MSHTGRKNPERHLLKMECQEHKLDNLYDKDFARQTTVHISSMMIKDKRNLTAEEHLTI